MRGCPIFTGGTAACVVASRLASADANLRVLLLEAGPTTYNDPAHTVPLNFMSNLTPSSRTVRWHVSKPSTALGSRAAIVPCGQCLGGGGSINSTSRISLPLCTNLRLPDRIQLTPDSGELYSTRWQSWFTRAPLLQTMTTGRQCIRTLGGGRRTLFLS